MTSSPPNRPLTFSVPFLSRHNPIRVLPSVGLEVAVPTLVAVVVSLTALTARTIVVLAVLLLLTTPTSLESTSRRTTAASSWTLWPAVTTLSLPSKVFNLSSTSHARLLLTSPWLPSASRLRTLSTLTSMFPFFFYGTWLTL